MRILSIDPATVSGWSFGPAGEKPAYGFIRLRDPNFEPWENGYPMEKFLTDMWSIKSNIPDYIVIERPSVQGTYSETDENGEKKIKSIGIDHIIVSVSLANAVHSLARWYGIPFRVVAPATWRNHILGAKHGLKGKDVLKKAVLKRNQAEGYLPFTYKNTDASDAVGIWRWAELNIAKVTPKHLVLHGEEYR